MANSVLPRLPEDGVGDVDAGRDDRADEEHVGYPANGCTPPVDAHVRHFVQVTFGGDKVACG